MSLLEISAPATRLRNSLYQGQQGDVKNQSAHGNYKYCFLRGTKSDGCGMHQNIIIGISCSSMAGEQRAGGGVKRGCGRAGRGVGGRGSTFIFRSHR